MDDSRDLKINWESLVSNEKSRRHLLQTEFDQIKSNLAESRKRNSTLESELLEVKSRLAQCDSELALASEHLKALSVDILHVKFSNDKTVRLLRDNSVLKSDNLRLLELLEHFPSAKPLLERWKESGGMSYIGSGQSSCMINTLPIFYVIFYTTAKHCNVVLYLANISLPLLKSYDNIKLNAKWFYLIARFGLRQF